MADKPPDSKLVQQVKFLERTGITTAQLLDELMRNLFDGDLE